MVDQQPATTDVPTQAIIPQAEPGLTVLHCPHPRSGALHRVALRTIRETTGPVMWIDARNTASTYALAELAPTDRMLERIRIARAFTAYQHCTLVERAINQTTPETGGLVVPNLPSLYCDDDVPGHEAADMIGAVVDGLATLGETLDIPVIASTTVAGRHSDPLKEAATATIRCVETRYGYRFEGETVETHGYWTDGAWQTTIPYWVDLFGPVGKPSVRTPLAVPGPRKMEG